MLDLGLTRRPLLEPNLNASGLLCLSVGRAGPAAGRDRQPAGQEGAARTRRSPRAARTGPAVAPGGNSADGPASVIKNAPLPTSLKQQVAAGDRRAGAGQSWRHLALVLGLLGIGWRHFERPITGMAMAACYLLLPYTRMALVDSGQLIPAALIVAAVFWYTRPAVAGVLIGLAAGWIPACLGLIALWCGFYRGRGAVRFTRWPRASSTAVRLWATGCPGWRSGPATWVPGASSRSACCPSSSPGPPAASG